MMLPAGGSPPKKYLFDVFACIHLVKGRHEGVDVVCEQLDSQDAEGIVPVQILDAMLSLKRIAHVPAFFTRFRFLYSLWLRFFGQKIYSVEEEAQFKGAIVDLLIGSQKRPIHVQELDHSSTSPSGTTVMSGPAPKHDLRQMLNICHEYVAKRGGNNQVNLRLLTLEQYLDIAHKHGVTKSQIMLLSPHYTIKPA